MSTNQHPKSRHPSDSDLRRNPGVGQSPGLKDAPDEFEDEKGDNTVEGDVLNDTTPQGGIDPDQRGRTNK